MSNVRLPIETNRDGDKITKVCVEDVYKIMNRIIDALDKAHNNSVDIINSIDKEYTSNVDNTKYIGSLIIGTGVSQPCIGDCFDEEIGNDIAFMKAKLNANIKKYNFIKRILNEIDKCEFNIYLELYKIEQYILDDIYRVRKYNPNYLKGFEHKKLGIDENS